MVSGSSPRALSVRLREHYAAVALADPAVDAILTQACRVADRLDRIDEVESGRAAWIELLHFRVDVDAEQEVAVTIDGIVSESRQQALALKQLVSQLPEVESVAAGVGLSESKGTVLDELERRRASRKSSA